MTKTIFISCNVSGLVAARTMWRNFLASSTRSESLILLKIFSYASSTERGNFLTNSSRRTLLESKLFRMTSRTRCNQRYVQWGISLSFLMRTAGWLGGFCKNSQFQVPRPAYLGVCFSVEYSIHKFVKPLCIRSIWGWAAPRRPHPAVALNGSCSRLSATPP